MVHRGGDLLRRRIGPVAKMVQRDFRARQILQVFSLDAGEQHHAFKIVRETGQLFADFHDGFQKFALHSQGMRNGIIRFRFRLFVAAIETDRSRDCTDHSPICGAHMTDMTTPRNTMTNGAKHN